MVLNAVGATDHRSKNQKQHVANVHQHKIDALERVDRTIMKEEDESSDRKNVEDHVTGEWTAFQLKVSLGSHSTDTRNEHQTCHSRSSHEQSKKPIPNN